MMVTEGWWGTLWVTHHSSTGSTWWNLRQFQRFHAPGLQPSATRVLLYLQRSLSLRTSSLGRSEVLRKIRNWKVNINKHLKCSEAVDSNCSTYYYLSFIEILAHSSSSFQLILILIPAHHSLARFHFTNSCWERPRFDWIATMGLV